MFDIPIYDSDCDELQQFHRVLNELKHRAMSLIEKSGKLSPGKIALYVVAGQYSAAISGGVLKVGTPSGNHPFLTFPAEGGFHLHPQHGGPKDAEAALQAFRDAMVLEDLADV